MDAHDRPPVLIVDDQVRNLDALEAMLESSPCTPVRARTPDEALLTLLRHDVAAIVLDIRMPEMSGIELASLIKERKRSRHTPILFLTAHPGDERDVLLGYGVGAVDYLSKPVNPEILRSKVGVFVDLFRKGRALAEANEALQREILDRERAEQALRVANQELERRVQDRTSALLRAHQGVLENEERLRMAMEVAQVGGWEWHLGTARVTWLTAPEELFGFPAGAFGDAQTLASVVHPEDRPILEQARAHAEDSGSYEANFRLVRPDGRLVSITERGRLVTDVAGRPERILGVSRDVTAEREAAAERESLLAAARDARDEAERQVRLKDEFLATLSHELRTPMNAILGWLSILQSGKPVADPAAALSVIRRNAQVQARLIDDLLDMTRLMLGNMLLETDTVDLTALLQSTIQGLLPVAVDKGVELVSGHGLLPDVQGDARRLQQVVTNLVHNAIKFTPAGGCVRVRAEAFSDRVEIAVTDTGRGISPAFLPFVFERFRQEDSSATRDAFGLGIGLSIAKHLVELHGGTIVAQSAGEDQGATFLVTLPIPADGGRDPSPPDGTRHLLPERFRSLLDERPSACARPTSPESSPSWTLHRALLTRRPPSVPASTVRRRARPRSRRNC